MSDGSFHVIFNLLLLKKLLHGDDVSELVFTSSRVEGDHLVVSPVGEFQLDLSLFLLLIGIHRWNIQDWGGINLVSPLAPQVLQLLC